MKPEVLLFQGTSHDPYWYNRAAGPYKLATYLGTVGCNAQVIPNCTALTRSGYEQVFRKYASENLVWFGFTTNWLAGRRSKDYYDQWWNSSDLIVDVNMEQWFHVEIDQREEVYSCVYDQEIFYEILDLARSYNPDCQMVFGGSQLNRNEYFHPDILMPDAHYIQGNAEVPVAQMHKRFRKKNFTLEGLNSNTEYDYNGFKTSFINYKSTDAVTANEWLPIEIARGCAFKCKFCNYDMKDTRNNYVDAKTLKENLIRQYEKWGTTKYTIMDDLYNDNYDKVQDLYDNCWSQLPFQPELGGYLRLDLLWKRPDQAELLYKSGFRCGSFGIETLHDKAGKAVGKGLGKARIIETLEMLKEIWGLDLLIHAFFIAGLPYEDQQSLLDTVEWTTNTPLIHSTIWHWLELENTNLLPPDTNVNKISVLGKNPEKYGYNFVPDRDLEARNSEVRKKASRKIIEIINYDETQKMEESWKKVEVEESTYHTNWENNAGVNLEFAKHINKIGNGQRLNTYFTIYADKRATGQSHKRIMLETINNMKDKHLIWENEVKKIASIERLLKIIT
jgi:hypothetical protein